MEDRYYNPKIDEFHVGFEYEHLLKDNFTGCTILCYPDIEDVYYDIPLNKIRVKHLDSSDIESLGFKLKVENKFGITFANRLYSIVYSKMKFNHIEVFLIQPYINESDGLKFSGIIKNKSELKKLLIQLEIINE